MFAQDSVLFEWLNMLVEKGSMTIAEWKSMTGSDIPNGDPFYQVITIERETIKLDREKLLHSRLEDMYAWHYAIESRLYEDTDYG